jgi:hypothetical protein
MIVLYGVKVKIYLYPSNQDLSEVAATFTDSGFQVQEGRKIVQQENDWPVIRQGQGRFCISIKAHFYGGARCSGLSCGSTVCGA